MNLKWQRQWTRFPKDVTSVNLWADGAFLGPADVLNESFGGIAVAFAGSAPLELGQSIEIEHGAGRAVAIVRDVNPREGGSRRVGLEWVRT